MGDEEMVERVTKAIFEADGGTWPITDPTYRDLFDAYARAAIGAMREPTPPMLKAACKAMSPANKPAEWVSNKEKHTIRYQAMIDMALTGRMPWVSDAAPSPLEDEPGAA